MTLCSHHLGYQQSLGSAALGLSIAWQFRSYARYVRPYEGREEFHSTFIGDKLLKVSRSPSSFAVALARASEIRHVVVGYFSLLTSTISRCRGEPRQGSSRRFLDQLSDGSLRSWSHSLWNEPSLSTRR